MSSNCCYCRSKAYFCLVSSYFYANFCLFSSSYFCFNSYSCYCFFNYLYSSSTLRFSAYYFSSASLFNFRSFARCSIYKTSFGTAFLFYGTNGIFYYTLCTFYKLNLGYCYKSLAISRFKFADSLILFSSMLVSFM